MRNGVGMMMIMIMMLVMMCVYVCVCVCVCVNPYIHLVFYRWNRLCISGYMCARDLIVAFTLDPDSKRNDFYKRVIVKQIGRGRNDIINV